MPRHLNADLHCHSVVSDGTMTPEALALRARENGVELWALTDHDDIGGQALAQQAALDCGLPYLNGIEISVSFDELTVHIVGLGLDPQDHALRAGLAALRSGREARAREIGTQLARVGIAGAFEAAVRHAGNPALISRTHFARHLVEVGVCADMNEVFRRFLVKGKPGYVPYKWASLKDAVRWITGAGGLAVLAHPGRYAAPPLLEYSLFDKFKKAGGLGVEVVTAHHGRADEAKYAQMAQQFGLLASRGSDFHSPEERVYDLGVLPELPTGLPTVWDALTARVAHTGHFRPA